MKFCLFDTPVYSNNEFIFRCFLWPPLGACLCHGGVFFLRRNMVLVSSYSWYCFKNPWHHKWIWHRDSIRPKANSNQCAKTTKLYIVSLSNLERNQTHWTHTAIYMVFNPLKISSDMRFHHPVVRSFNWPWPVCNWTAVPCVWTKTICHRIQHTASPLFFYSWWWWVGGSFPKI